MVTIEGLDKRSREGRQITRMLSIHRANERGYRTQEESFTALYPGQWIGMYNRGRNRIIAKSKDDLLRTLRENGHTTGTEFVIAIPHSPAPK